MTDAANQRAALSVVLPVYNGASFIHDTLRDVLEHLASRPWRSEVIVVDDGSTDGTAALATEAAANSPVPVRVLRVSHNEGKGAAIARGVRAASGAEIVFLDADLAYPPDSIDALHAALAAGADLAVANRVHRDSRYLIQPAFFGYLYRRHLAGRLFNALVRLVLLPGLRDTQAGLKGFNAAAAARLFATPLPKGFGFDLGLLARARELGLRIDEIPVRHRSDSEPTTVRFLLDSGAVLRDLLLLRFGFRLTPAQPARRRAGLWQRLQPRAAAVALIGTALAALLLLGVTRLWWPQGHLAIGAWGLLLAATGLLAVRADRPPRHRRRAWGWPERLALAGVLAVGAALRLVALSAYPPMVHIDSAECGLRGLAILHGQVPDVFDFSPWYDTPYLSFVPYAASYAAVGSTILALRLPSALLGTLTLVPLYVFARTWFGRATAWITTALVAVSHVAIHFSRIGLWNIQTLFYEMTAFAFLAYGVRRQRVAALFAAGVVSGLALYSYTAGRLIVIVALVFLATLLGRGRTRRVWRLTGFYLLGVGAAAAPLLLNYIKTPSVLEFDRSASVWVLAAENQEHVEATLGTIAPLPVLWRQTLRTLGGFGVLGDSSSQYGTQQPLVTAWIALLAVAGLLLALRRGGVPRYRFLALWCGLGLVLGSVLILDPPSHTRLLVVLPLPYLLAALALVALARRTQRWLAVGPLAVAASYAAVVALAAVVNLRGYRDFNELMREMPREWDVLRAMERLGDGYDYYLFTGPFLLADSPIFQLFTAKTRAITAFTREDLPDHLAGNTAFIVLDAPRSLGAAISDRFPGSEREVIEQEGHRQMVVYRCAAADGCDAAFN